MVNAAFRWDDKGLAAYWPEVDKTTSQVAYYNKNKFVKFDHNGLYGWLNGEDTAPTSLQDIYNEAPFSLTWKGFSLKNENGSVRISSDEDIQVLEGKLERIRIGRLTEDGAAYGIRISKVEIDEEGTKKAVPVMETDDSGELWLRNELKVGTGDTRDVSIGYLDATRNENGKDTNIHEVIRAGGNNKNDTPFVVLIVFTQK